MLNVSVLQITHMNFSRDIVTGRVAADAEKHVGPVPTLALYLMTLRRQIQLHYASELLITYRQPRLYGPVYSEGWYWSSTISPTVFRSPRAVTLNSW